MTPRAAALQALLVLNGVAAGAAAVVLAMSPAAIPSAVGLTLTPGGEFVARLLAAAECAVVALCLSALLSRSRAARSQVVQFLVVFHVASASAGVVAAGQGAHLILWNVLAQAIIVAALIWSSSGTSRSAAEGGGRDD